MLSPCWTTAPWLGLARPQVCASFRLSATPSPRTASPSCQLAAEFTDSNGSRGNSLLLPAGQALCEPAATGRSVGVNRHSSAAIYDRPEQKKGQRGFDSPCPRLIFSGYSRTISVARLTLLQCLYFSSLPSQSAKSESIASSLTSPSSSVEPKLRTGEKPVKRSAISGLKV